MGIGFIGTGQQLVQGISSPEPPVAHGDPEFDGFEIPGFEFPQQMGFFYADKGHGPTFFQALEHSLDAHARPDHENGPCSPDDADPLKAEGQTVGFLLQLGKGHLAVKDPAGAVSSGRVNNSSFVRISFPGFFQAQGDIGIGCHKNFFFSVETEQNIDFFNRFFNF